MLKPFVCEISADYQFTFLWFWFTAVHIRDFWESMQVYWGMHPTCWVFWYVLSPELQRVFLGKFKCIYLMLACISKSRYLDFVQGLISVQDLVLILGVIACICFYQLFTLHICVKQTNINWLNICSKHFSHVLTEFLLGTNIPETGWWYSWIQPYWFYPWKVCLLDF